MAHTRMSVRSSLVSLSRARCITPHILSVCFSNELDCTCTLHVRQHKIWWDPLSGTQPGSAAAFRRTRLGDAILDDAAQTLYHHPRATVRHTMSPRSLHAHMAARYDGTPDSGRCGLHAATLDPGTLCCHPSFSSVTMHVGNKTNSFRMNSRHEER